MPERIALVTLGTQQPYLDVKLDGKEYTIRCDEKGIHIWSFRGVKIEMMDILRNPSQWAIIK